VKSHIRKLDKLIIRSFIGPFVLTLFVVVFILLIQLMLNKMDEFVGKDLGFMLISELMFYFSINISQTALPLAVLLSSLMTFGNLGEYSELTATKGAGISLLRALRPAFILAVIITVLAFLNNNFVVTKANLKAYSLLYDIKKHKPSLDIKEGTFYNGIPDISIKVNKKYPDGETLGDIIIYNHQGSSGNNAVTFADSGRMYSVLNNRYLMFELYNGKSYEEIPNTGGGRTAISNFIRSDFESNKIVLSLASFDFKKSKEDLWTSHYYMKNIHQLKTDVDSMGLGLTDYRVMAFDDARTVFGRYYRDRIEVPEQYHDRLARLDSIKRAKEIADSIKYKDEYNREETEEQLADSMSQSPAAAILAQSSAGEEEQEDLSPDQEEQEFSTPQEETQSTQQPQLSPSIKASNPTIKESAASKGVKLLKSNDSSAAINSRVDQLAASQLVEKKVILPTDSVKTRSKPKLKPKNKDTPGKGKFIPRSAADSLKLLSVDKINVDSIFNVKRNQAQGLRYALAETRNIKNKLAIQTNRIKNQELMITKYQIEMNKKYAQAFACLVMFLIGAPLGAIIKKGGFGVPVIISIIFFILYYVMSIVGKKWAEEDVVSPFVGIWGFSFVLLPVGLFFLRQAKNDARLLESDFYAVAVDKIKKRFFRKPV